MHIVFHLGLHCTDGGLLIRSILQNRARLLQSGVAVPGPLRYRELLGETSTRLRGAPAPPATEALILEALSASIDTQRVILSNENFLCRSDVVLGTDCLYPKAHKSSWLRQCLPTHEVEFAIALRNPASFLPDLINGAGGPPPPTELLHNGIWLDDLSWSDVVMRIVSANPGARVLVWCHEDTPFIWSEIQHEVTGQDNTRPLEGELDMAETIMTPEGYKRLNEFLETRDVRTAAKRRRAVSAFLETHAIRDEIEAEIDLPDWTNETVETLTELYEDDIEAIARLPEVSFISP